MQPTSSSRRRAGLSRAVSALGFLVLLHLAYGLQPGEAGWVAVLDEGAAIGIGIDSADDSGGDDVLRRDRPVVPVTPALLWTRLPLPELAALLARPVQHPSRAPPAS